MMGIVFDLIGGAAAILSVLFALLWSRERGKRKEAQREARTHKEMRAHEHEASQLDDTSLADRITRR
jgi:FtsZ-interacting cell division protein ZipA